MISKIMVVAKELRVDLSTLIIVSALLVSAPRLAAALSAVEPAFLGLPIELLTGPAFGLSTAGATVYVWHTYNDRKKLKLAPWLMFGWIALLGLIAIILVPGMVVEMRKSELASLLKPPWDIVWCFLLAISSELVVGLAALARSIAAPRAKGKSQSAPKATQKIFSCDLCGAQASISGKPFRSMQAVSAHKRFCPEKDSDRAASQ